MSCTFGPVTLLSGVTGTGAGSTIDLGACYGTVSWFMWAATATTLTAVIE
jgi:hypothetical protein